MASKETRFFCLFNASPHRPALVCLFAETAELASTLDCRLSPNTLYAEALTALLNPAVRSLGPILITQLEGAVLGTPLPLSQSVLLVWPQITGLLALTLLLFTGAYVAFQRQEVRA